MARLKPALALALVLLAALVVQAPAHLVGRLLPPGTVVLQGYSDSLWRGAASRCLLQTGTGYVHLGRVTWSLAPWSLALLSPRLVVASRWGSQHLSARLTLGRERLRIRDLEARLPADLLRQVLPVALAGDLSAQVTSLALEAGRPVSGAGRLVWQRGEWLSPAGLVSLGSYALAFADAPGGGLAGDLLTLAGPVRASGELGLSGDNWRLDATVTGDRPLHPRLAEALALVAVPVAGGFRVELDGTLR